MIILITGSSHTGKTALAQKLLERYRYPVLSLDLLKMGLIRSRQTSLTPEDDDELTPYLWDIVAEIVKTAIENDQSLIVEGCYVPFDWQKSFSPTYLAHIRYCCLVMTRTYIEQHADDILRFANVAERRLHGKVDLDVLARDNEIALAECRARNLPHHLIDERYDVGEWTIDRLSEDQAKEAANLVFDTVHAINTRDYTAEQVDAWAPGDGAWRDALAAKLSRERTIGVCECGILIGFGSLDENGDIDLLYVHKDRQRQGIARRILRELEALAADQSARKIHADASLTARPFFERMGYTVVREQTVTRRGVKLINFRMEKRLETHRSGTPHERGV